MHVNKKPMYPFPSYVKTVHSAQFHDSQLMYFTRNRSLTRSIWTGWSGETKCWQVSRHDITFRNSNNL